MNKAINCSVDGSYSVLHSVLPSGRRLDYGFSGDVTKDAARRIMTPQTAARYLELLAQDFH